MNPETTALVLIEFQNDFTSEGGVLHGAVQERDGEHRHARARPDRARGHPGRRRHGDPQPRSRSRRGTARSPRTPTGSSRASSTRTRSSRAPGAPTSSTDVAPADGDIVVEGKRGLDAFGSTNLDFILRSKGITTVVLAGFLTNCCVESTMRSAYEKGFEVITLTDAVGATSQAEHDNAITYDYPMFSKPMTADEYVGTLQGAAVTADASRGY